MASGDAGAAQRLNRAGFSYGTADDIAADDATAHRRLWILVGFLCFAVLGEGYDFGVLNGALVRIQDEFDYNSIEVATIVTSTPLSIIPGALIAGWMADSCGRWWTLIWCVALLLLGPIAMALAPNLYLLVAGRALTGCGIGTGFVVVSMYIAEMTPSHLRGQFVSVLDVALNVGILLGYIANWALLGIDNDWRWMIALGSIITILLIIFIACGFVPESPRWLLQHGRREEAFGVLKSYVGEQHAKESIDAFAHGAPAAFVPWRRLLCPWGDVKLLRMLSAGVAVAAGQTICGYLIVLYYSSKVMKRVMDERTAFKYTVIMGAVKAAVAVVVVVGIDRVGRRPALLASTVGCLLGCVWIATAFSYGSSPLLVAAGFWLFNAGFSLGFGPVTFVYITEIFPTELRAKAVGLCLFGSRTIGVLSTFSFPLLTEGIGVSWTFSIMAAMNVFLFGVIWLTVRETKGCSLEDSDKIWASAKA